MTAAPKQSEASSAVRTAKMSAYEKPVMYRMIFSTKQHFSSSTKWYKTEMK